MAKNDDVVVDKKITLHLHDERPILEGEEHGPRGPTHAADVDVDFPHEASAWVLELEPTDLPTVFMIECPVLGKVWDRNEADGKFRERKVLN